jgi:hypothetical protein
MGFATASRPTSSFGYYRGGFADGPFWQGQGSGMGMAANTQGVGVLSQGQGPQGAGGWHPTVLYLGVLIIFEMFVFGLLSKMLR